MKHGPWRRWFAWYPVPTPAGWRWLVSVERAWCQPPDVPFPPEPVWVYRPRKDNA